MARALTSVKITLNRYCGRDTITKQVEVPAYIADDLAVHRAATLQENGEPSFSVDWTVSHIPTGASVAAAAPYRCIGIGQRKLIAWAKSWQIACPEYFAAIRKCSTHDEAISLPNYGTLASNAIQAARALWSKS